jgi:elongation factor G
VFVEKIVSDSGCMIVRQENEKATLRAPSELVLESLLAQINQRVQLPIRTGACYVLYLETITRSVEAEGKEIRQSKERDHYGHVRLTLDPQELGKQFQFINAIQHGAIPEAFIPTIQQAISKGLQKGVLKGFPVVDVVCTLFDGSYHDIDSSNEAFEKAALRALANGLSKAAPVLLEPIMKFEIRAPEGIIPSVLADLEKRRAKN